MKLSVSNMTDTVRDAAARLATGISQFFSRNTTAILTYLGYKAKRAQVVTDEYITPIGDNLKATAKDAAVTATLASDIATQEVVSPVRSFGITAKASIKAAGTGVARWVKSSWSATVAGFKSFTNGLYTGVAQMGTSVRNFFTGFVNAVKNNWREMTRGWGKATRKARHTVVLPSKKGVANAEKQRQSGLAFILSRPAAWWRAAKHELSVLSWKASAKTYEPRAAVKNAYASVGRNGKYAWGRAGNAVTYHAKGLYISVGSTLSAWFASLGYAGRAAVGTTSKVRHAVSEAAPNPTDALEAASLAVQSVYSEAARVTSTTSNNLSAGVKATASQAVHALHKPARPAREKGGKLKNKTLHQKDKGVDAATAAGEGLLNTGVLGVALAGGALLSAHAKLKGGAQAVVAAAGQFVAVTGSVVGVMLVNPAQAGWRQAKQSGAHAAYLTVYRLGDTGQTIKDGVSSALAAPGRVASWTTLNVTNALDDALPGAYYALARTGLTVNYYGAVACDGMVYAAQVTGNAVMVPVRFVAETLVDGADTMVAQAKQLGYQTDLVSGKASTAIQVTAQTKWAAFFNAAAPVIYDFGDAIFNVQTTALHLTSDAANSVRGNVRDIGYAVRSGGHVAWDAMNDTGARVMFYVKIVGVSMLAVPVRGAFNTTHAVNSAGSALQSGFGTVSQALSYRVNQAGTAIFYAGSQLNEARKNRRAVIIEGVSYGLSGHWDGAQYVANQASAQVRYALGGLYNPFARLKAFFQKAGYIFNQKGHTACFAVIQGADVAGMAVIDVVPDVAQAARFAVEGCGDAVILAAKGVQVSAGNACGEAAVTVQTKGASGLHSLGKQKDALAFAAKDAGARLAVEAQNTGTQVGVAAGQLKDDMVEPVARVKDSVVHTAKEGIEHVRHAGVNTWQQGKQGVQSSGMVLTSAASQTFNTTVDQTVIAWQKARAEVGKKFDNGLEHLHKNYHVDYMRKPATS